MFRPDEHRTMHFHTTGTVIYDPLRDGKVANEKGWCIIDVDVEDLMAYYAYQFYKKFGIMLDKPSWKPHLSVIVGEASYDNSVPWKYRDGEEVDVSYSHYMFWNKNHVWLAAQCDVSDELREHYSCIAKDRGHITIGRIPNKHYEAIPEFKSFNDLHIWNGYPFNSPLI